MPKATLDAAQAGNDLLLMSSGSTALEDQAYQMVLTAVRSGAIPQAQVQASAQRVLALHLRYATGWTNVDGGGADRIAALPGGCSQLSIAAGSALSSRLMAEEAVVVEAAGREVPITSPDKVFFAERGDTKLDLVRYYQSVEEPLMRAMGGRPVLLQRFPNGAGGSSFFQKRVPELATRSGSRRRSSARRTAQRRRRSSPPTWLMCCGPSTSAASASMCGRRRQPTRTTPTSCASTSTPHPASPSTWSRRLRARCMR